MVLCVFGLLIFVSFVLVRFYIFPYPFNSFKKKKKFIVSIFFYSNVLRFLFLFMNVSRTSRVGWSRFNTLTEWKAEIQPLRFPPAPQCEIRRRTLSAGSRNRTEQYYESFYSEISQFHLFFHFISLHRSIFNRIVWGYFMTDVVA